MSERWEPEAVQDPDDLEACRSVLAQVASRPEHAELAKTKLGIWPRLYLREKGAVKFAFLLPVGDGATELHVFPGDTLEQAQVLFVDASRPDALLRLLGDGWQARPNFHFGFREAGYAWQNATAPVDRYIDWCLAYVPRAGELKRHEWDRLLDELESRGFASPGDKEKFHEAFASRTKAVPRPGIHFWKTMAARLDARQDLADEVRTELGRVLGALREPLR